MYLIIGLGNPGNKYCDTRHNIGFTCLEYLRESWGFPGFRSNASFRAECSEGKISTKKIFLARPNTFMNRSGDAVQSIVRFYKLDPKNIVVIHDDLDIPLGEVRTSFGSRSAGHNGVEDIIGALGTKNFLRFRIGIKRSPDSKKDEGKEHKDTSTFVLEPFPADELRKAKQTFSRIEEELHSIITQKPD